MFTAIRGGRRAAPPAACGDRSESGSGRKVLLIDHEDSFVHTLASYIRTTGAEVVTMRPDLRPRRVAAAACGPISSCCRRGPAGPRISRCRDRSTCCVQRASPVFGVCLGLQGIVEYFGGSLGVLDVPMHGKPSLVRAHGGRLLRGLPSEFTVGRYHSLLRGARHFACGAVGHRRNRGRRRHGDRAQEPADRRGAVPPGIGDDLARRHRHADHRRRAHQFVRRKGNGLAEAPLPHRGRGRGPARSAGRVRASTVSRTLTRPRLRLGHPLPRCGERG